MTNLIEPAQPRTLGDQRTAIGALTAVAGMFGNLPAGHISLYRDYGDIIGLSLDSPAELEAWRVALGFNSESVELHVHNGSVWLSLDGAFLGARFSVNMHQVPVSFEAASVSPAEDAERFRRGQLAEQQHQSDDPAEPEVVALVGLPATWSAAGAACAPLPAATSAADLHLRACRRAEYAHLLHDVDPDSTVPAIVVSLVKARKAVAR